MSKKKRKRNEHKHEDFIFIGINGTTGKFQKLKNQDKSNEDFLSFLKCLDGRAEQSSIPVEKGSGKYPYVNFKKNIADDFKQQFEKHSKQVLEQSSFNMKHQFENIRNKCSNN